MGERERLNRDFNGANFTHNNIRNTSCNALMLNNIQKKRRNSRSKT